jgi:Protein of unknown function (DUF3592)
MNPLIALAGLLWLITSMTGIAACVSLVRALRLAVHRAVTAGRIVGHEEDPEGSNVRAVVEYVVAGASYRVATNAYVRPAGLPIGAPRQVAYMPDDPRRSQVVGVNRYVPAISLWIVTLVVGALAAGLTYLLLFA